MRFYEEFDAFQTLKAVKRDRAQFKRIKSASAPISLGVTERIWYGGRTLMTKIIKLDPAMPCADLYLDDLEEMERIGLVWIGNLSSTYRFSFGLKSGQATPKYGNCSASAARL